MSGVFWEQDRQPNLCEAASGFTFSTINLLVAIPMALVDLLVSSLLYAYALLLSLLLPLVETVASGLLALAEVLGLNSIELPAAADLVAPGLAVLLVATMYREHRQGASCHQLAGKYCLAASGLLWLAALHAAAGFAVAPRLAVVSLALNGASFLPGFLVAAAGNFRSTALASSALGGLLEVAKSLANLLKMEAGLVVAVAAYGYPELLGGQVSAGGELAQYLCAVPFFACVLVYSTLKQQQLHGEDQSDGAPLANGSAVGAALAETKSSGEEEEAAATEPAAAEAAAETAAAPVEEEQSDNAAAEESVGTIEEENPAAEPPAGGDVTAADPAPEQPAVNESSPEPEEVVVVEGKEHLLLAKIKSRLSCLVGGLVGWLAALGGLVAGWLSALAALPWLNISLALAVAGSHLLTAAAWTVLAGNQLALALPLFTLATPLTLDRCGTPVCY
jgi:hypothetical protein